MSSNVISFFSDFSRSHAAANAGEVSPADVAGYDSDLELARSLILDSGLATPWAIDVYARSLDLDWDIDDGRHVSGCGSFEIGEDPVYGTHKLFIHGKYHGDHATLEEARFHAQRRRAREKAAFLGAS